MIGKIGSHNLGVVIIGGFVEQDLLFAMQNLNTSSSLAVPLNRSVFMLVSAF